MLFVGYYHLSSQFEFSLKQKQEAPPRLNEPTDILADLGSFLGFSVPWTKLAHFMCDATLINETCLEMTVL